MHEAFSRSLTRRATLSGLALAAGFDDHLGDLGLEGLGDHGTLTADNYGDCPVRTRLRPAATTYGAALSQSDREGRPAGNPWIT